MGEGRANKIAKQSNDYLNAFFVLGAGRPGTSDRPSLSGSSSAGTGCRPVSRESRPMGSDTESPSQAGPEAEVSCAWDDSTSAAIGSQFEQDSNSSAASYQQESKDVPGCKPPTEGSTATVARPVRRNKQFNRIDSGVSLEQQQRATQSVTISSPSRTATQYSEGSCDPLSP